MLGGRRQNRQERQNETLFFFALILVFFLPASPAAAVLITFDEWGYYIPGYTETTYGVTFLPAIGSGSDLGGWSQNYVPHSLPLQLYSMTADSIRVTFNDFNPNYVGVWYCAYTAGTINAYDASDVLLGSASGGHQYGSMAFLSITANNIKYITLVGTHNQVTWDDLEFTIAPVITSWSNNMTNDIETNLTFSDSMNINFNATANQTITTWTWLLDSVNQTNNYDNISLLFTSWQKNYQFHLTSDDYVIPQAMWDLMDHNGNDTRFKSSNGSVEYPFWIEWIAARDNYSIWVNATDADIGTIRWYYNDPTAESASNVTTTFIRVIGNGSLVGSYHMDEAASNTVPDTSGIGNNGISTNTTLISGKHGNGLYFNGTANINLGDVTSWNFGTGDFALETWFNWDGTSVVNDNNLFRRGDCENVLFRLSDGNTLGCVAGMVTTSFTVTSNIWHHFIMTRNSGVVQVYVDNILKSTDSIAGEIPATGILYLGAYSDGTGEFFHGILDETKIYKTGLSDADVSALYSNYGYTSTAYLGYVLVTKILNPTAYIYIISQPITNYSTVTISTYRNYAVSVYGTNPNGTTNTITWQVNSSSSPTTSTFTPPSPTDLAYTTDNASYVNWTWQEGTGDVTDSYNVSVNTTWTNGSTDAFYNHTVTYSGWSNITVQAYNSSGTGTLNETAVTGNVQLPQQIITLSFPTGWAFIASNYTNKTLLELNNTFSTSTVQGFYDNTTKKYVNHYKGRRFNENQTVSHGQGYYYYFTSPQDVEITIPASHSTNLITGWNLVGNFGANRTLSDLDTSIGTILYKQRYNTTTKKWADDDLDTVKQGEAFFAYVYENTTWTG